jgi:hypothetical protein
MIIVLVTLPARRSATSDLGAQMDLVKLGESLILFRQTTRYTSRWRWYFPLNKPRLDIWEYWYHSLGHRHCLHARGFSIKPESPYRTANATSLRPGAGSCRGQNIGTLTWVGLHTSSVAGIPVLRGFYISMPGTHVSSSASSLLPRRIRR